MMILKNRKMKNRKDKNVLETEMEQSSQGSKGGVAPLNK